MGSKLEILNALQQVQKSPLEFHYDQIMIPPIWEYVTQWDINELYRIVTSVSLSGQMTRKLNLIDEIMRMRNFRKFAGGTNRVVYKHLEDKRLVAKIAIDQVGLQDNDLEFKAQRYIKPYCAKMFYTSPRGVMGFSERVIPITTIGEFEEAAVDVFNILVYKILGRYVVEDVGTLFFKNYGIRPNWGPVLVDYPFVYPLDGKKLYCTGEDPRFPGSGITCDGEIDYDDGFNFLQCGKCGRIYKARDLRQNSSPNSPIRVAIGGKEAMKVKVMKGNEIVVAPMKETRTIQPPRSTKKPAATGMKVSISGTHRPATKPNEQKKANMPLNVGVGSASKDVRDLIGKTKTTKNGLGSKGREVLEQATTEEHYTQLNLSDHVEIDDRPYNMIGQVQYPGPIIDSDQPVTKMYYLIVDDEGSIYINYNTDVVTSMPDAHLMQLLHMINHANEDIIKEFMVEAGIVATKVPAEEKPHAEEEHVAEGTIETPELHTDVIPAEPTAESEPAPDTKIAPPEKPSKAKKTTVTGVKKGAGKKVDTGGTAK